MGIKLSWLIGFLLSVTAIIVFSSHSAFETHREKLKEFYRKCTTATPADNYETISGWLYVWLFTASVVSLKIVLGLIQVLPPFNHVIWASANDPMAAAYDPLLRPLLLFKLVSRTTLLWVVSVMAIGFLNRRQYVPKLAIGFLVANLLVLMTEQLLLWELSPLTQLWLSPWKPFPTYEFALAICSCLFWVPYFLSSKRVKLIFSVRSRA
ncbi:MAG TPA: DUF2569 family protein [Methylomirabilota bacterium]|nr:DUF2569 family protein [Methylomirabilota bacterium]